MLREKCDAQQACLEISKSRRGMGDTGEVVEEISNEMLIVRVWCRIPMMGVYGDIFLLVPRLSAKYHTIVSMTTA
jgi:hypothetical protein